MWRSCRYMAVIRPNFTSIAAQGSYKYLELVGAIWRYLDPFGPICTHLELFWNYMELFGAIWSYV